MRSSPLLPMTSAVVGDAVGRLRARLRPGPAPAPLGVAPDRAGQAGS